MMEHSIAEVLFGWLRRGLLRFWLIHIKNSRPDFGERTAIFYWLYISPERGSGVSFPAVLLNILYAVDTDFSTVIWKYYLNLTFPSNNSFQFSGKSIVFISIFSYLSISNSSSSTNSFQFLSSFNSCIIHSNTP